MGFVLARACAKTQLRAGAEIHTDIHLAVPLAQLVAGHALAVEIDVLEVFAREHTRLHEEALTDVERLHEIRGEQRLPAELQSVVPLAAERIHPRERVI